MSRLTAELGEALPADMREQAPRLAHILFSMLAAPQQPAEIHSTFTPLLAALAGQQITTSEAILSFGAGSHIGEVTIGDVAAGNIVKLHLSLSRQTILSADSAYDVRGLPNPYLGLRPFTYAERERFGGRERQVARAVAMLCEHEMPLLFVTGSSGSGKSSFVQAGVLPALAAHHAAHGRHFQFAVMRPTSSPLARLSTGLAHLDLILSGSAEGRPLAIAPAPQTDRPAEAAQVLVIDQFEELFTQADSGQREVLFALFADLSKRSPPGLQLIATLRSDYLPELFALEDLYQIARDGIDLRAMRPDELQVAIRRPLAAHPDRHIEPALCERLANDAAGDAAYLPLLQVTLEDLWRRGSLSLAAYGVLTDAIRQRAEEVYAFADSTGDHPELRPETERQAILALCSDLVDVSLDDDTRRDVRRRRSLAELAGDDPLRLRLIDDLVAARLLSRSLETRGDGEVEVIDIVHESLIGGWDRLQQAVAERRALLQRRARFELSFAEWRASGRPDDLLLGGARLAEAEGLAKSDDVALRHPEARAYLSAGLARREDEQARELAQARALAEEQRLRAAEQQLRAEESVQANRRLRRRFVIASLLAIVAVVAGGLALFALDRAGSATARAEENARLINLRDLASQSTLAAGPRLSFEANPVRGALLATELLSTTLASGEDRVAAVDTARAALSNLDGQVIQGHWSGISAGAVSRDGRTLATGGFGDIRLWDLSSADPAAGVRTIYGHETRIASLTFSADGRHLLSAGIDGRARLWDLATPEVPLLVVTAASPATAFLKGPFVALSPDGSSVILADTTGAIVRHVPGTAPQVLGRHESPLEDLALSPDGHWLASGDKSGTVLIWDLTASEPVARSFSDRLPVEALAFSPDSRLLAVSRQRLPEDDTSDDIVEIWSFASSQPERALRTLRGDGAATLLMFSPDSRWLLTAVGRSGMGSIPTNSTQTTLWDLAADEPDAFTLEGHRSYVTTAAFSPDSQILATGGADISVQLWNLASLEPSRSSRTLRGHDQGQAEDLMGGINTVFFLSDSELVTASGPSDPGIRLYWGAARRGGSWVNTVSLPSFADSVALLPNSSMLATAGFEIEFWDMRARELFEPAQVLDSEHVVGALATDPQGRWLFSGDDSGRLNRWALSNGLPQGEPQSVQVIPEARVLSLDVSPDGSLVAVSGLDSSVKVYTTEDLQLKIALESEFPLAHEVSFSPDGRWLLIQFSDPASPGYRLALWRVDTLSSELSYILDPGGGTYYSFSPDGKWLAVDAEVEAQFAATVYDLGADEPFAEGRQVGAADVNTTGVSFADDGQTLVVSAYNHHIYLYDFDGPIEIPPRILRAHENSVSALAVSPDGRWLISGSEDGAIWQWDLSAPDPQLTRSFVDAHDRPIRRILIDPTGEHLVVVDTERIRVFPLQASAVMAALCQRAGRNLSADEWTTFIGSVPYRKTCAEYPVHASVFYSLLGEVQMIGEGGSGDTDQIYAELRRLSLLGASPQAQRDLCRYANIHGRAEVAREFCDRAVAMAPADPEARFWRGVSRALGDDLAGATDDLAAWLDHVQARQWPAEKTRQRETWLAELRSGRNPFSGKAGLEQLRNT